MPTSEGDLPAREDSSRREEDSRTCALSRRPMAKEAMIRFVAGPDGSVVPDIRARLPGRGVWIEATREAVSEAVRRKTFARSLKAGVKASPTLADDVEGLLCRDVLQALSLANKAGAAVTGFGKVEALAANPDGRTSIAALLHAREAAPDGRRKLAQALHRGHNERSDTIPIIDCFEGSHLDLALGRTHVIHAALVAGSGSDGFMTRWHRLARYCMTGFSTPRHEAHATSVTPQTGGASGGEPAGEAIMGQE